ncbi:DUF4383 domain-containing protein [Actinophytocola sp.]|uniref:DUF4383 domain-containing protein n=1 Tax=Actinophytocola sp. TaxID=1872138 RepID=UPI002ED36834
MAYSNDEAHLVVKGMQPAQLLAALESVLLVVAGGFGLFRIGTGVDFDQVSIFGLTLNPLQSQIFLVAGMLGMAASLASATARTFGWLLFLGGGLLFAWGLMLNGLVAANPLSRLGDPLGLTVQDGWWHLVIAVSGLVIAVIPAHKAVRWTQPVAY